MSQVNCKNIVFVGFRATGKSFIGRSVAAKLGWDFIEMDQLIEDRANMSIDEFTKNGTEWQDFRQLEQDILQEVIQKDNAIISCGGGVGVNNIIKDGSGITFGEINRDTLLKTSKEKETLVVVLNAKEKVLERRIRNGETRKIGTRPILDEDLAGEVREKTKTMDEAERREFMINKIVEDSMNMYKIRKPLYAILSENIIDTSTSSIEGNAREVIELIK